MGMRRHTLPPHKEKDPCGMKEKYLHSLGALFCEEGRFDEAIETFREALVLDDAAYTHYHLSLAFLGIGDLHGAARELDRAVEREPAAPEYYYERSLLKRRVWDLAGAASDLATARGIDPEYGRIGEIKGAIEIVRRSFGESEFLRNASCPVSVCPAYCCHFTGPTVRHGLALGAWKLLSVRTLLREQGLLPEDFLEQLPFHGEEHILKLVPPHHIIKERDGRSVFFPRRGKGVLKRALLTDLPKGPLYQTLMWSGRAAKPCAFLHERRCMIYDAGDEAGLEACAQFLCLTGYVFVILEHLGITGSEDQRGRRMGELNTIAVEALLVLARTGPDQDTRGAGAAEIEVLFKKKKA